MTSKMQKIQETVINYQELTENRNNIVHIFKNKQIYRERKYVREKECCMCVYVCV